MKLEILDPDNELNSDFGQWLCTRIQQHFVGILDSGKLKKWDEFFVTSHEYIPLYSSPISTYNLLRNGIQSLTSRKFPDKIVISLNKNQYVPGFDRVKLETFFRLITFGNISVSGYPVFLDTLQYFVDHINDFIELYDSGV